MLMQFEFAHANVIVNVIPGECFFGLLAQNTSIQNRAEDGRSERRCSERLNFIIPFRMISGKKNGKIGRKETGKMSGKECRKEKWKESLQLRGKSLFLLFPAPFPVGFSAESGLVGGVIFGPLVAIVVLDPLILNE